jgi:hypothetical protein
LVVDVAATVEAVEVVEAVEAVEAAAAEAEKELAEKELMLASLWTLVSCGIASPAMSASPVRAPLADAAPSSSPSEKAAHPASDSPDESSMPSSCSERGFRVPAILLECS